MSLPVSDLTSSFFLSRRHVRPLRQTPSAFPSALFLASGNDDARLVLLGFIRRHLSIGADDQLVADAGLAGRRAIEADHAGAALAFDDIGREAFAVVDVVDLDTFVEQQARRIDQILVDRDRAFIMEIALRNGGAVHFAFEHREKHQSSS